MDLPLRQSIVLVLACTLTAVTPTPALAERECVTDAAGDAAGDGPPSPLGDLVEICASFLDERLTLRFRTVDPVDPAEPGAGVEMRITIGETELSYRADNQGVTAGTTYPDLEYGLDSTVCGAPATFEDGWHVIGPLSRACFQRPAHIGPTLIDSRCLRLGIGAWGAHATPAVDAFPDGTALFVGNWAYGSIDPAGRPDDLSAEEAMDPHIVINGARHDHDPATWQRTAQEQPAFAAIAISRGRFPSRDGSICHERPQTARHVVLARSDEFSDALSGAALVADGPMLLTESAATGPVTASEIDRVLEPGGIVYLLGGEAAIAPRVEEDLVSRGYVVRRLAGATRVETALAVADELLALGASGEVVGLARATAPADNPTAAWADALAGGAWAAVAGAPLLVTPSDELHPAVRGWLERHATTTVLFGGAAALSSQVEAAAPGAERVAGADRAATAVAVAGRYLPSLPQPVVVINGYRDDGWAFGLPAAGISVDRLAPLMLVGADTVPPSTLQHLTTDCLHLPHFDVLVIGAHSVIDDAVADELEARDPLPC